MALTLLLMATMITVVGPTAPAKATCGDAYKGADYKYENVGGFNMGRAWEKQNVGCYDGNVRFSSHTAEHRGQWRSNAGVWKWSSVGIKSIPLGYSSPVVTMIAGPISVGRWLRIGTDNLGGTGIWWF
ncbi:MAG: hypothetical protein ABFR53_03530 [Actinomycetota bacterium]